MNDDPIEATFLVASLFLLRAVPDSTKLINV